MKHFIKLNNQAKAHKKKQGKYKTSMTRRDRNAVGKRSILLALEDERGIRVLPVKSTRVFPVHIFHALSVSGVWVSAAFVKDNDTSKYSLMAFTIYCL